MISYSCLDLLLALELRNYTFFGRIMDAYIAIFVKFSFVTTKKLKSYYYMNGSGIDFEDLIHL